MASAKPLWHVRFSRVDTEYEQFRSYVAPVEEAKRTDGAGRIVMITRDLYVDPTGKTVDSVKFAGRWEKSVALKIKDIAEAAGYMSPRLRKAR